VVPCRSESASIAAMQESVSADLPLSHLCLACAVIVLEALAAHLLELGEADQLLIAGVRAFLQLTCLGGILYPIFQTQDPGLVMGYIFGFMVLVSAYEAAARPKVTYPGMFWHAACSVGGALLVMGCVLLAVVEPTPWYNAQYVIPLAGMLINNALSGVALALNGMIDHLTARKEYVEVLLAFGATPWEASWPGFVKAVQAALIPAINGMNVIGLVSIPGMMTGQILGGAPPMKAAKYQIAITFLISGCSFAAVVFISLLTIRSFFDAKGRHHTQHIVPQTRIKVAQLFDRKTWRRKPASASKSGKSEPLLATGGGENSPIGPMELRIKARAQGTPEDGPSVLSLDLEGLVAGSRPLHAKLELKAGEVACIMGPSGIGKSTLLKWICDLQAPGGGSMSLAGQEHRALTPQHWRREVIYVHQSKAPLPDAPADLLRTLGKLKVNRHRPALDVAPGLLALGLTEAHLERPWNELSGGEAQRVMLAIALAQNPTCLVLDEPTSALDDASKRMVEERLVGPQLCVLLVTHDEQQSTRIGASVWQVAECAPRDG